MGTSDTGTPCTFSWTRHASIRRSEGDGLPLVLNIRSIFDDSQAFGPLDAVIGFLVFFERLDKCCCVSMDLAEHPIAGEALPQCSMSADATTSYDWSNNAPTASEQYELRKLDALQKSEFHRPTIEVSASCDFELHSMHSMPYMQINDLVAVSKVRA